MIVNDLETDHGIVRWRESGDPDAPIAVIWHHGTPGIGAPPGPLLEASEARGIRWLGFDRPGYGGTTASDSWSIADAAAMAASVADAAGAGAFAVVGHSGGGPHALACAALLGERVTAAISISGLAPHDADGLDWYAGMYEGGVSELRTAINGHDALHLLLEESDYDPEMFTPEDHAALEGEWDWFNGIAAAGTAEGVHGMVADDVAYVNDWRFSPAAVTQPTLVVHGTEDRIVPVAHAHWLADRIAGAELWERPGAGHLSVMHAGEQMLDWLVTHA
ncbi:MAG: alpha/beta hydrolase [Demequina sp.]|nr:alpha/beta hydrolase [Demequina sp.]